MKIALFQLDLAWEDRETNFGKVNTMLEKIKGKDIGLVCLPELFATGYTMNSEALAEDSNGECFSFLSDFAKGNNVNVVGSVIGKTKGKPENRAIVFDKKGEFVAGYSKIHLPGFTKENEHYAAGSRAVVFEIDGAKIGIVICFDLRFPELFKELAAKGAEGIIVIASWPRERIMHWDVLLGARAIENQLFVIGVNRVGESPLGNYNGHSVVIGPGGEVVASMDGEKEGAIVADIDFGKVRAARERLPLGKSGKI